MPDTEKREERQGAAQRAFRHACVRDGQGRRTGGARQSAVQRHGTASRGRRRGLSGEAASSAADVTGGQSIGEFADSVVSGLEQANLVDEEKQSVDLHGLDLEHMTEAFFAGWGEADGKPAMAIRTLLTGSP